MSHYQHLIEQLKQLRLGGLVDSLELRLKEAEKQQLSYLDFLSLLIQDELQRRSQSKFARRLKKGLLQRPQDARRVRLQVQSGH